MAPKKKSQSFNAPPPDVEPEVVADMGRVLAKPIVIRTDPADSYLAPVRICPTDKSRSFTGDRCDTCGATWREA